MIYRLSTSEDTKDKLLHMKGSTNITPNILCRYCVTMSLNNPEPLDLSIINFKNKGLELNRNVLTGRYDKLFKALISHKENKYLTDDIYYEKYLLAHIERGVQELYSEFNMAGNADKFISRIASYQFGRDL